MKLADLKSDNDYLGLPETERAKVVEHLTKNDTDFHGLDDTEKVKVLNHLVGMKAPPAEQPKTATVKTTQETGKSYSLENPFAEGSTPLQNLKENATSFGKGLVSGAADIGNTLINASTYIPRKIENIAGGNKLEQVNANREEGLKSFNKENEGDVIYGGGRLAGNIAGTAGVGGGAATAIKGTLQSPKAIALADSIASSGLTGTTTNKILGGATNGALQTLLIDPENVKSGAALGAAIPVVGSAAKSLGNVVADVVGALGTHTGGQSIKTAAASGLKGGKTNEVFKANMRGNVPITDVLDDAKTNLQRMAQEKSAEYKNGMQSVSGDKTVLSFNGIDKALQDASQIGSFKGQNINKKAGEALTDIKTAIDDWKKLDPKEFHTPEGLDALKKKISGIQESIPFEEKTARTAAGKVYSAIKSEIANQAPTYDKVMKGYSEATEQIAEIEKALSLGKKASVDTAIRKLQSLTRNNVNTNYGNRLKLAQTLEEKGGKEILPALAGQSLNTITPRGLGNIQAGGTAVASLLNPQLLPLLLAQSPRLVGELANATGATARNIGKAIKPASKSTGAIAAALNR